MSTDAINLGIMDHHTTPAYKRLVRNQLRTAYCVLLRLFSYLTTQWLFSFWSLCIRLLEMGRVTTNGPGRLLLGVTSS